MPKKASTPTSKYVPMRAFCDELGISERTGRRYIAAGKLPAYRVGGQLRIDREAGLAAILKPMNDAARVALAGGATRD